MKVYKPNPPVPMLCSFYTPMYRESSERLLESLRKHANHWPRRIVEKECTRSWVGNCGIKPAFMLDTREKYPGVPLVWLDADAEVKHDPSYFAGLADAGVSFAAHLPDPKRTHDKINSRLLSGTLFFGATDAGTGLLRSWVQTQTNCRAVLDQENLYDAFCQTWDAEMRFVNLPRRYVCIPDLMPETAHDAVIVHHQASRQFRERIG